MLLCVQPNTLVSIVALCCSGVFIGLQTPMLLTVGQTFAGPFAGARWMGVQNSLGNVSGIVAPIINGWLVDKSGNFGLAFAVAAGVSIAGLIAWVFLVGPVRTIDWTRRN
jgi:MFS family permease